MEIKQYDFEDKLLDGNMMQVFMNEEGAEFVTDVRISSETRAWTNFVIKDEDIPKLIEALKGYQANTARL